jgi:hypothetical protein
MTRTAKNRSRACASNAEWEAYVPWRAIRALCDAKKPLPDSPEQLLDHQRWEQWTDANSRTSDTSRKSKTSGRKDYLA